MRIFQPSVFQGSMNRKNYFEGWYVKCVNQARTKSCALIFGVSLQANDSHGFIQMIDGQSGETNYARFDVSEVRLDKKCFAVQIGANYLDEHGVELDITFPDRQRLSGQLAFGAFKIFPVRLRQPGIMGWYRYVPTMECYHALVSLTHQLNGHLTLNGDCLDFQAGTGYIEKDWGTSMPKAWIWSQSNHGQVASTNYMLSIADIPWRKQAFNGFLGYIDTGTKLYHFATYTGARLKKLAYGEDGVVEIIIVDANYWYHFLIWSDRVTGILQAPVFGAMNRQIHEAIQARAHISIYERHSANCVFDDEFKMCGFERVGHLSLVLPTSQN